MSLLERTEGGLAVTADIQAPGGTLLKNAMARLASTAGEPCQAGVPVSAVAVDGEGVRQGPAAVGGAHRITLRFAQDPAAAEYPVPDRFLEVDLAVGGHSRCLRAAIVPRTAAH
jgi:hypothetical protein